ncbi:hypothetical protein HYALB_00006583 [Hymenoscyphus albidus]|uniref:Uncharacterized protein n=1 Tax=Hymenoscyphus albidus TaxID=595503 RepID=A0A9N9LNQ3_9HELO|nr:hypothetical protein HYALB_00006583 [Hymenoscyphus albidus]
MLFPSVFFAVTVLSILVAGIPVPSAGTGALSTRGLRTLFGSRRGKTGIFRTRKYGEKVNWIKGTPIANGAPGNPHVEPLRKSNLPKNPKKNDIWIQGKPIPKGQPGNPHWSPLRPQNPPKVPYKKNIEKQGKPVPRPEE